MVLGTFAVVAFAAGRSNTLVPSSYLAYPRWESGPLHGLFRWLPVHYMQLSIGFSVVVLAMLAAYGIVLAAIRTVSMRTLVITILALHAIVLLSPPQQLTDVFNYLGYARLGGLHHLNPYTHVINAESTIRVPVHQLAQPAEPLRAAVHRAHLSAGLDPVADRLLAVKVATMLASLSLIAIVWQSRASSAATRASRSRSSRSTRST